MMWSEKKIKNHEKRLQKNKVIMVLAVLVLSFATTGAAQADKQNVDLDEKLFQASIAYLQTQDNEWVFINPAEEFRLRSVYLDDMGQYHVRLDQVYNGIPVFGFQVVVHFNSELVPISATGAYKSGINVLTKPKLSGTDARTKALGHFPGPLTKIPDSDLVLYVLGNDVLLAYRVDLENVDAPQRIVVFIDAQTGKKVESYNDLRTPAASSGPAVPEISKPATYAQIIAAAVPAPGTGYSMYSGPVNIMTNNDGGVFTMIDPTRGNMSVIDLMNRGGSKGVLLTDSDNVWGNSNSSDRATAGVDAHFGSEMTWDYYLNTYGRNGIFNDSAGTLSRVHFRRNYNNAFWSDSCKCMTYGDGDGKILTTLTSLDVVGHEMTHGVTSADAGLIYRGESGGLNEAMSDIFGTMIEYYASTHGATKTANYLIGEDIFTPGTSGDALRYMNDPTLDGSSIDTYANYTTSLDVHYSSGIANNAYYLLAEGGTHRLGTYVPGIGREKAEKIFYRALTAYMIPGETFSQARADTIRAASDLYGVEEVAAVQTAWSAVGVN